MVRHLHLTTLFYLSLLATVSATLKNKAGDTIYTTEEIYDTIPYLTTLRKLHPNLKTCFFHHNGHLIYGIFHDKVNNRLFFPSYSSPVQSIKLTRNDKLISPIGKMPALKVPVATVCHELDGTLSQDPENTHLHTLGYWLENFELTDTFEISIEYDPKHIHSVLHATYDPDFGWRSSISRPAIGHSQLKKSDAYWFQEEPLTLDLIQTIKLKEECVVRLKQNDHITINRLPEKKDPPEIPPLQISLKEKTITINNKVITTQFIPQKFEKFSKTCFRTSPAHLHLTIDKNSDQKVLLHILENAAQHYIKTYLILPN